MNERCPTPRRFASVRRSARGPAQSVGWSSVEGYIDVRLLACVHVDDERRDPCARACPPLRRLFWRAGRLPKQPPRPRFPPAPLPSATSALTRQHSQSLPVHLPSSTTALPAPPQGPSSALARLARPARLVTASPLLRAATAAGVTRPPSSSSTFVSRPAPRPVDDHGLRKRHRPELL